MGLGLQRAFAATRLTREPGSDKYGPFALRIGYRCPTCNAEPQTWCVTEAGAPTKNLHAARKVPS